MLRINKYNNKKKIGLNSFFKKEYDCKDVINCEIKNMRIRECFNFNIIKDDILETYVMAFKNIVIIHLEENQYKDFIYLYDNSREYCFDVYSTINYKDKMIYHVFCISKYLDEMNNYDAFVECNDCEYKYNCLTKLYGPNLVINKRFDARDTIGKIKSNYIYFKTIGKSNHDNNIKNLIVSIIHVINTYYLEYLPINYLNI